MTDHSEPVNIETPEGQATAHKTTVDPTPQTIVAIGGDALQRIHSQASQGPAFAAAYLAGESSPDLKAYDTAFRAWQTSNAQSHTNDEVIEILGGVLGEKCVADFDMEWVTVTDEYGTDYAVRGKNVEVMAFPFSTVAKRIENREHDFLYGVYYTIAQTLDSPEYRPRGSKAGKWWQRLLGRR